MPRTKKRAEITGAPYLLTFSDLIYGVLIGYSLQLLGEALTIWDKDRGPTLLLALSLWLICDNWYGSHFIAVKYQPPETHFWLRIIEVVVFFALLYTARYSLVYFHVALASYAIAGYEWDRKYLMVVNRRSKKAKSLIVWRDSAAILALATSVLALTSVIFAWPEYRMPMWSLATVFGIYLPWRCVMELLDPG